MSAGPAGEGELASLMLETPITEDGSRCCDRCGAQLIELDRYGERLTGCLECNVWWGSKRAFIIELSVEDFEALRRLKTILIGGR
jgi:hypothetical protein